MRLVLFFWLLFAACGVSSLAEESESVTKREAIEAFRSYRAAVKLISSIHWEVMRVSSAREPGAAGEIEIPEERLADYRRARELLERSIELNPFFPDAHVLLANSYWEIENDLEKTLDYYSKALEIDPDYDDVISARGQVFVLLERFPEAEKDLERLEALKSEHAAPLRQQLAELKAGGERD